MDDNVSIAGVGGSVNIVLVNVVLFVRVVITVLSVVRSGFVPCWASKAICIVVLF